MRKVEEINNKFPELHLARMRQLLWGLKNREDVAKIFCREGQLSTQDDYIYRVPKDS